MAQSNRKSISRRRAVAGIQQGEPFIYCLTTRQGAVKIGISRDVGVRLGNIGYGGTERLLAFRPGTLEQEQDIHDRLAPYALPFEREYYYPTDEVIEVAYWIGEHFDISRLTTTDFPDLHQIAQVVNALVATRA